MAVWNNLDPLFASRMEAILQAAEAATGGRRQILSGYRDPRTQAQLYANWIQQPISYQGVTYRPTAVGGRAAAPPGYNGAPGSRHQVGQALDLAPGPVRDWVRAHVGQYGLETLNVNDDPGHIQLARNIAQTQYDKTASGPSPSAAPVLANATSAAGGRSFLGTLIGAESGGRNIPNVTQGTTSGPAQGYLQITTGTWREFGAKAGIDLSRYPNALSAPPEVQAKVGAAIPMVRWAPETLNKLQAAGFHISPNATLEENVKTNGGDMSQIADAIAESARNKQPAATTTVAGGATTTADNTTEPPPEVPDLASIFGGGGGGGGYSGSYDRGYSGGLQTSALDYTKLPLIEPDVQPAAASADTLAAPWTASQATRASPPELSNLFTVNTIGMPSSRLKALQLQASGGLPTMPLLPS